MGDKIKKRRTAERSETRKEMDAQGKTNQAGAGCRQGRDTNAMNEIKKHKVTPSLRYRKQMEEAYNRVIDRTEEIEQLNELEKEKEQMDNYMEEVLKDELEPQIQKEEWDLIW